MLTRPVIPIAPRTWLISEYRLVNMYLLEGETGALLIDCGVGLGNVAQTVREITDKPLSVAISHGHFDHDGAAMLFKEVHMHPLDFTMSEEGHRQGVAARTFYAKSRGPVRNPDASTEELLALVQPDGPVCRVPMEDGAVFDLGGRKVEVIHTPGHSLGSVCFLDSFSRLLFTGDMANDSLLLNCGPTCATVEVYNQSIRRLWARESEFDAICQGHDALAPYDKSLLAEYIEATDALLAKAAAGEPGSSALHSGICYTYKRVKIWYDPQRLLA